MNYNLYNTNFFYFLRPRKRTYLEMLYNSNQIHLINRIDNYKIKNKALNDLCLLYHTMINENNTNNPLIKNFEEYNNSKEIKKNLLMKKNIEYDAELERKIVENYYRIKNAELNRLRFVNF